MQKPDHEPQAPRGAWLKNGNRPGDPNNAPRCGAKTRRGTPCKGPAMRNGRCRMHGGPSTGPKTPEGLERSRKANWKHGFRAAGAKAELRQYIQLWHECKALLKEVKRRRQGGQGEQVKPSQQPGSRLRQ
ncbi:MAG: HGGxSTG domain-containing protein [Terriglobia bacterium]